jgi:type I restriction enzyme S subunit
MIYITIVNRMPIAVPCDVVKQTAIANVLSDVDALIQSLTRLIAKKRQIKKDAGQVTKDTGSIDQ